MPKSLFWVLCVVVEYGLWHQSGFVSCLCQLLESYFTVMSLCCRLLWWNILVKHLVECQTHHWTRVAYCSVFLCYRGETSLILRKLQERKRGRETERAGREQVSRDVELVLVLFLNDALILNGKRQSSNWRLVFLSFPFYGWFCWSDDATVVLSRYGTRSGFRWQIAKISSDIFPVF